MTVLDFPKLPNSVTLSAAKGLARWAQRCFAALSMTAMYLTPALWLRKAHLFSFLFLEDTSQDFPGGIPGNGIDEFNLTHILEGG